MRECHLFVMPSFYEGVSLVTMEALASGLRVVSNELPGMREWVGTRLEEEGIVEYVSLPALRSIDTPLTEELPAYEERLARGIARQLEGSSFFPVCRRRMEEMVRKYSWESVFQE